MVSRCENSRRLVAAAGISFETTVSGWMLGVC